MTKDEYKDYLKNEIAELTDLLKNGRGEPISLALLICEKNRLVDKLYEFECKTAPVAFKIGDKVIGGSGR